MKRALFPVALAACGVDPTAVAPDAGLDAPPVDTSAMVLEDQAFRDVGVRVLAGDVYIPEGPGPFPAVLVIHGGGFANGAPDGMAEVTWASALQAAGYVAFSVDYRVNRDFEDDDPDFPRPLEDLKCAVRWLRQRAATLRVDPEHVFALGGSAGGNLTALLGVTGGEAGYDTACGGAEAEPDLLSGVVDYYGPVDFAGLAQQRADGLGGSEARYVGSECTGEPDLGTLCLDASVAGHLDAADPPFFVAHSDDDPVVPVQQSRDLVDLVSAAGLPIEYREITGQGHGWHAAFNNAEVAAIRDEILVWLDARTP